MPPKPLVAKRQITSRGSAVLWVLVIIALFAALNFAFMQNTRGGGGASISAEKTRLLATEIIDYGRTMQGVIKQLRAGGCKETDISFQSSTWASATWYNNPTSPSNKTSHVFEASGGAMKRQAADANAISAANGVTAYGGSPSDWAYTGANPVYGVGKDAADTSGSDLVMFLIGLPEDLCLAINKQLGYNFEDASLLKTAASALAWQSPFQGTYARSGGFVPSWAIAQLKGKMTQCVHLSNIDRYVFYQVLITR